LAVVAGIIQRNRAEKEEKVEECRKGATRRNVIGSSRK
jgi:hypothetical protein